MRQFLFLLLTVLGLSASAQVGISSFYNVNEFLMDVPEGSSVTRNRAAYPNGSEIAINYWFRLPKKRIEFQPTVYYARAYDEFSGNEYGFQFKTNIYPFDLGTDCDCPTFGKQGPQLEKGFFIQLSPGITALKINRFLDRNAVFTLAGGIGVDFGLSNLVTLSPIASVRYTVSSAAELEYTDENNVTLEVGDARLLSYQLGLQATFRFDKKRY